MANVTIKLRRGQKETWETKNPTLAYGEPGVEKESRLLKIGDGNTPWTELPFLETMLNKTNEINETSTDSQYPTAKAVFTALSNISTGADNNPLLFLYTSLSEAIEAINTDNFINYIQPDTVNIAVLRYSPNFYRVDILNNITETTLITITKNIDLYLNGKTVVFNGIGTGLSYEGGCCCKINGEVEGSTLIKNNVSSGTNKEPLLSVKAKSLEIKGGSYITNTSGTYNGQAYVISASSKDTLEPANWASMSNTEAAEWVEANRDSFPRLDLQDCTLEITGVGRYLLGILSSYYNVNCQRVHMNLFSGKETRGISGSALYGTFEDCNILCTNSGNEDSHNSYAVYTQKGCILSFNRSFLKNEISNATSGESITVKQSWGKIYFDDCLVSLSFSGNSTAPTTAISSKSEVFITNSKIYCDSNATTTKSGLYIETAEGKASAIDSEIEGIDQGLCLHGGSAYMIRCTLKGHLHGGIYENVESPDNNSYFKDCTFIGNKYSGDKTELSTLTPEACALVLEDIWFDSCKFEVDENCANLLNINGGTAYISNCTAEKLDTQKIVLNSSTSNLKIGAGGTITANDVTVGSGSVEVTNELYRHLEPTESCSGKDLSVVLDYISNSITNELSTIVDGEEN